MPHPSRTLPLFALIAALLAPVPAMAQAVACKPSGGSELPFLLVLLTGKQVLIPADSSDTIEMVKEKIKTIVGPEVDQQRLIFKGKELEDNRTPADYGINACAELHLVLRLRGG